jgi:anti-sigma factor RsiW
VSALCETVRERLPRYLGDALGAEDRRRFREHLVACDECRDRVVEVEPSLLFVRTRPEEVSSEDVARVLAGVRGGIALAETERKVGRLRGRSRRRVAATAAAAALGAMTLLLPGWDRRPVEPVAAAPVVSAPASGFSPASEPEPGGMFPAEATIYDWNPGAANEEPRVVWIVDQSLDI